MFKSGNNLQLLWVRVGGLLVTPLLIIILELVAYFVGRFEFPGPLYVTGVICAILVGGLGWGVFSMGLVLAHALITSLLTSKELSYNQTKFIWLITLVISFGFIVLLVRLWQNYQKLNQDLSSTNAGLSFLAKASNLLASSLDYETILENLTRLAIPELADSTTIYRLNEDSTISRVARAHRYPDLEKVLLEIDRLIPVSLSADSPLVQTIKNGQVYYIPVFNENEYQSMSKDQEILALLKTQEVKTSIAIPLIVRGKVLGALGLVNTHRSGREFTPATRLLAEEFAQRIAQALDNARLYQESQTAAQEKEAAYSQLNSLMESLPIGLAFGNRELECGHLNQTMAELVGGKVEEFSGKSIANIIPKTAEFSETLLRNVLETGQPMLNMEVNGADWGLPNYYLLNYYPVRQRDGQIIGVGMAMLDVTERKMNEIALRQSQERFLKVFNHAPIAIVVCDLETGAIVDINDAIIKNMGLVPEEVVGRTMVEFGWATEEDLGQILGLIMQDGGFKNLELKLANFKDGQDIIGLVSAVVIELDGRPCILAIFQDITVLKETEEARRQSEERFTKIFNFAPMPMSIRDLESRELILMNQASSRKWQVQQEQVEGTRALQLGWGSLEQQDEFYNNLEKTRSISQHEGAYLNPDGSSGFGIFAAEVVELEGRLRVVTAFTDLTELKQAEEARRRSDTRFAKIFNTTPLEMTIRDLKEGRLITANETLLRTRGVTLEEIVGKTTAEMGWSKPAQHQQYLNLMQEKGAVHNLEVESNMPSGEIAFGISSGEMIELDDQACFVTVFQDITAQKKNEAALRQREQEFKALVENSPDIIARYDRQLRHLYVSPVVQQITGQPPEFYLGRTFRELDWSEAQLLEWERRAQEIFETGESQLFDYSNPSPTGKRYFQARVVPEFGADGKVESLLAISRDLTDLKLTANALSESEAKFRAIAEVIPVGISIFREDEIIYHNPAIAVISGYPLEELDYLTWSGVIREDYRELIFERSRQRQEGLTVPNQYEFPLITKKGEERWIYANVGMFEYQSKKTTFTALFDITERKKAEDALRLAEEQLRQSQKLEAVGRLAGGVAHDFNNLLTAISGYSRLIQMRLDPEDRTARDINEIIKAADRAAKLTAQLLAFSRKTILQPKQLQLNELVANLERLLERLIGEDVELVTKFEPNLGIVRADPSQLEQIIMNLVVNAQDAMPDGGRIIIETANLEVDDYYAAQYAGAQVGGFVTLTVSDNGAGIPPEIQERIFEPFFTTKDVGKGTGLGLATVYGIVKQSGGNIWVHSEVGIGTTFKIFLPRLDEQLVPESPNQPKTVESPVAGQQRGTILLVEDEEMVRKLTNRVLTRSGYAVVEAKSGPEALQLLVDQSFRPDLLLTDLLMPKMTGAELARRAAVLIPNLKVLYITGYSENGVVNDGELNEATNLLLKPYTPDSLLERVNQTLDRGRLNS